MRNKYCLIVFSLFLLPFVSANLVVLNNSLTINKVYNSDLTFSVSLYNNDSFSYYNLFADNSSLKLYGSQITALNPGETANFVIVLTGDDSYNGVIRIKGYTNSSIGHVPETKNVIIKNTGSNFNVNPCDVSIVKSDTIIFSNSGDYDITNNYFSLNKNTTYTQVYNNEQTVNYVWKLGGWVFSSCNIYVLGDSGLVSDPTKDAIINLNLNVNYPSTTLSVNNFNDNYTLHFYETDDGVLSITNIGNYTAKNITLFGDWFSNFNYNNFDLDIGKSKAITFKISPKVYITNDTGKQYYKNVSIIGNFNMINVPINIYLVHDEVNSNYTNSTNFLDYVCSQFPQLCTPQVVYKYISGNENSTSYVPVTDEQWRQYNIDMETQRSDINVVNNLIKETQITNLDMFNSTKNMIENYTDFFISENNDRKDSINTLLIIFIIFIIISIASILVVLIILQVHKSKREKVERY